MTDVLALDEARCHGEASEAKCQTCARRQQIALDDARPPLRWYAFTEPAIQRGTCLYWKNSIRASAREGD